MKKKIISGIILTAMLLSITSCNKEEVIETTTKPINVDRDDLMYAENEVIPEITTTADIAETTTTTAEEITTPATTPVTDNKGKQVNNPNYPSLPYEYKDSVYNTTIDEYISNIKLGKVSVFVWEEKDWLNKIGVGNPIYVGEPNDDYQHLVDIFHNGDEISCYDEEKEDYPFEIKIEKDKENPYDFSFYGAGHYIGNTLIVDTIEKPDFYFELETLNANGDRVILDLDYIPTHKENRKQYLSTGIKGIAAKLGDFIGFTEDGIALFDEKVGLHYLVETDDDDFYLYVGTPMKTIVDKIGEPIEITGKNKMLVDKEKNITLDDIEESTYYVYKTVDYTLVLETGDLREIAKEATGSDDYITIDVDTGEYGVQTITTKLSDIPDEQAEIITTIILIRNRVEYPQTFIDMTVTTTAETAPEEETTEISTTVKAE